MNITPTGQRPTEWVLLDESTQLNDNPPRLWVSIRLLDGDAGSAFEIEVDAGQDPDGWEAQRLGVGQVRLRFGVTALPTDYLIRVRGEFPTGSQVQTPFATYKVGSWSFFVALEKLHCLDESDELSASDEIQVSTVVAADAVCHVQTSSEMEDVDAGEDHRFRIEDKFIQAYGGKAVEVDEILAVTAALYEIDSEPLGTDLDKQTDGAYQLATTLVGSGDGYADVAGLVIGIIESVRRAAISAYRNNFLGEQSRSWSPADLIALTNNSSQSFEELLPFHNGDADGSYDLTLRISRV